MVYFENSFRWSFFHHNLKMHVLSCKSKFGNIFIVVNNNKMCDSGGLNGMTNEEIPHCEDTSAPQCSVRNIFTVKRFWRHCAQADGSSGSLAAVPTRLRTGRSGVLLPAGARYFLFFPKRPDWLWDTTSVHFTGYIWYFSRGKVAGA
jgi:hypothetical protein